MSGSASTSSPSRPERVKLLAAYLNATRVLKR